MVFARIYAGRDTRCCVSTHRWQRVDGLVPGIALAETQAGGWFGARLCAGRDTRCCVSTDWQVDGLLLGIALAETQVVVSLHIGGSGWMVWCSALRWLRQKVLCLYA
jgi:hypothetical protein